jgi:hypothetical protein
MEYESDYLQVRCPQCAWSAMCDHRDRVERLQRIGMLRRQADPDRDLVGELFRAAGEKLACDRCSAQGLVIRPVASEEADWPEARLCASCGQPIGAARLGLYPDARHCAMCQANQERGQTQQTPEYCPRCGSVMVTRTTERGGLTRYVLHCPQCGR